MSNLYSYQYFLSQFGKENLFEFKNEEHLYVLVGYPNWRAFIINSNSGLKLEVYPSINVSTRKLEFLEEPLTSKANDRFYLKVDDPAVMESYLEKEKKFFDTIPEEVTKRVKVFIDSHWEIIKAIATYGHHFVTLIDSNPVLAYLLVNLEKLNPSFSLYIDNGYLENLITEKQKEILGLAGFPASKRMVKVFSKFDPELVDVDLLKSFQLQFLKKQNNDEVPSYLRLPFLKKPERKEEIFETLSHVGKINKNLIHTLVFYPNVTKSLSSKALQELSESESFKEILGKLKSMTSSAIKWGMPFKISSIKNFDKIEEKFKVALSKRKDEVNNFPTPPIPDGEGIYALRTVAQQNSWAKKQQNCIRGYVSKVFARKCHLYRVILGEEEATLEILIQNDGLKFGQIKGFKDKRVSKKLWLHAKKWFDDYMRQQRKAEKKKYRMLELELK